MLWLLQTLAAWLLADFLTGLVHWFEDAYLRGPYRSRILQGLADDNDLHHEKPTAMLVNSGWVNMRSGATIAWPIALGLWWLGLPTVIWLAFFFAGFGNLVHRWAHVPARQLPRWIRGMQEFGLFISADHHDSHHRSMKQLIPKHLAGWKFCPMTDWVNPVLDYFRFWWRLEALLARAGLRTIQARMESE